MSNDELIRREDVTSKLNTTIAFLKSISSNNTVGISWLKSVDSYVRSLKPIHAVAVVRCKSCEHSAIDRRTKRRMCVRNGEIRPDGSIWYGTAVDGNHYCGYGVDASDE